MYNSYNSGFILEDNIFLLGSDFEISYKLIFGGPNLINEEDEEDATDNNGLDKRYFNSNNGNFVPKNDDNDKEIKCQINQNLNSKKWIEDIHIEDEHPSISLDEDKESELVPISLYSNKNQSLTSDKKDSSSKITKSLSSTAENPKISEKKKNLFELDNFKGFNLFHPGGKEKLFEKLKNEIQDLEKIYGPNNPILCKFKVKKKNPQINKRKRHKSIKRKFKPDNIRKKIKSRFFKAIRVRINKMLKEAKSKEFFDLLPQCFIINITKKKNQQVMDMPFKNLLEYNFIEEEKSMEHNYGSIPKNKWNVDIKKYEKNQRVIYYLKKNEEILKKSKFDVIGNMTVTQLFDEYLKSAEFEKEVVKLQSEGNDMNYIKDYISKAFGFINYFH
jgi:hypothetical protein